jgi:hypothetical protein
MSETNYAREYETGHVNVDRSAVRFLNASSADIEQSAVQILRAESVKAESSAIGMANAATLEVRESAVGIAAGDYVRVEESNVFVLLAPRVSGNVRATITLPVALAFGAGFFIARQVFQAVFGGRKGS